MVLRNFAADIIIYHFANRRVRDLTLGGVRGTLRSVRDGGVYSITS